MNFTFLKMFASNSLIIKIVRYLFILGFWMSTNCTLAQTKAELIATATQSKNYKEKIKAFYALGELAFHTNFDSASLYYNKAYALALKHNDLIEQHAYFGYIGDVYTYQGNYAEELKSCRQALDLAIKIK
jgi:tetratricopeptide (TPR) repeat protein